MNVKIKHIEYFLPERIVTNQELGEENPEWDMDGIEERTGVVKRHIAREDETALDLSLQACKKLFSAHENAYSQIGGIIFCTQSPDYIMPPNSCILHKMLDLPDNVFAFDFNLACSGYVYGLALAQGLIYSHMTKNILLINADTYSKYINKRDRSVRVLFGDGAAVSWITASDTIQGIVDIKCSTFGKDCLKFIIPAGACRMPKSKETAKTLSDSVRTFEDLHMDGMGVLAFVNSKIPAQIKDILERNTLTVGDIDLFVFHQASKMALDSLTRLLKIEPEKVFRNLREIGNTVSASIPIALKDAKIARGSKILISGFGVGLSAGTAIIQA